MAAIDRRKSVVFGVVLMAAVVATSVNIVSLQAYFEWKVDDSGCGERIAKGGIGLDPVAESALKKLASDLTEDQKEKNEDRVWSISFRAEGQIWQAKTAIPDMDFFHRWLAQYQKESLEEYCSSDSSRFFRRTKTTRTFTFYSLGGERLTSFSISPADCAEW
jgi:hypothetical protein